MLKNLVIRPEDLKELRCQEGVDSLEIPEVLNPVNLLLHLLIKKELPALPLVLLDELAPTLLEDERCVDHIIDNEQCHR